MNLSVNSTVPETQNRPGPNPKPSSKEKCSPNQALTHTVALPVQLATSSISEHLKGLGLKQSIDPPGDGMTWKCFEEVKNLLCDFRTFNAKMHVRTGA